MIFDNQLSQRKAAGYLVLSATWLLVPIIIAAGLSISGTIIGNTVASVMCAGCATACWRIAGSTVQGRALASVALMAQISILLAAAAGSHWQIDLHMSYFAALALLIVFCDSVAIIAATAAVALHHLVLGLLLPASVFPDSSNLGRVILHAVILLAEAGTLVWMATNLNNMFMVSQRSVEKAEQAADAARALNLVAEEARRSEAGAKERADLSEAEALAKERKLVVSSIGKAIHALANGQLGYRISERLPGEYGELRDHFNQAVTQLQSTMDDIAASAGGLHALSATITSLSEGLSKRTAHQMSSLEETVTALQGITVTVKTSAEGARQVASAATDAKNDATRSGQVMGDAITAMSEIERSSVQITRIIGVIDEIAFQTNLLALNAGVEAARAGDAGRGFAVVAQEVRGLAQRSAEAAKEIKALIEVSSSQVGHGVRLVGDTGQVLRHIVDQITKIDTLISGIALSTRTQAAGIDSLSAAVTSMDSVAQKNASMVDDTSAAASQLTDEAQRLKMLTDHFQTSSSSEARHRYAA